MNKIFEPIQVNNTTIKNRLVAAPMDTNLAAADGTLTERWLRYYEEKAKGGWGLIITEDMPVCPGAGAFINLPVLYRDENIPIYQAFTERVHKAGATILAQIYHAGYKANLANTDVVHVPSNLVQTGEEKPVSVLTKDGIQELIDIFADNALRAQEAGFDGVEIHGAHGYLLNQFTSPLTNHRTDEYGGSIENRIRLSCEIVRAIRQKVRKDFIVDYRMTVEEYEVGGLHLSEAKVMAMMLEDAGIDMINVTQGARLNWVVIPPSAVPKAYYVENAAAIKSVVNVPVVATGRINDPDVAESILRSGKADLCLMGRASLADPYLPYKAEHDQKEQIIRCLGCNQGCIGQTRQGNPIGCMVNPRTGRENSCDFTKVDVSKTIYIAGAGVAGCEAAIVAASRGHHVTLFEASGEIGGQWLAASVPPCKDEFLNFVNWQKQALAANNVTIRLNTSLTKAIVEAEKPDVVMVATGSHPAVPPITGIDRPMVVKANDVLRGRVTVGNNVAVIGGGLAGAETALCLAERQGTNVSIIEMLPQIVKDGEPNPNHYLLQHLEEAGVSIYTSAAVKAIGEHDIDMEWNGTTKHLDGIDNVVLASGVRSTNELIEELNDYLGQVIAIGDAEKTKNGYRNIREAFGCALNI